MWEQAEAAEPASPASVTSSWWASGLSSLLPHPHPHEEETETTPHPTSTEEKDKNWHRYTESDTFLLIQISTLALQRRIGNLTLFVIRHSYISFTANYVKYLVEKYQYMYF